MKIKINDKEYPIQFGIGAIEIYCDTMGCDLDGLGLIGDAPTEIEKIKAITTLILAGIRNGCELDAVDCNVNYRQLQAALDVMPQSEYEAIMEAFGKSKVYGKTLSEHLYGDLQPEQDKKKEEILA